MSSQAQVFHAASGARRLIARRAYVAFAAGAFGLMISAIVFGVLFASGATLNPTLAGVAGALGCAGMGGLILGMVTLTQVQGRIQVEVTPYRLTWQEGQRAAVLDFERVQRVDLVKGCKTHRSGEVGCYPVVRFVEENGDMMEFEVSFDDRGLIHHARFDALGITRAVLPHLHHHVLVSGAVTDFVSTGEVDIAGLPTR